MRERKRRNMYRQERLGIYLGIQISEELRDELKAEADRGVMRQSDFTRLMIEEGLRVWKGGQARLRLQTPAEARTVDRRLKLMAASRRQELARAEKEK